MMKMNVNRGTVEVTTEAINLLGEKIVQEVRYEMIDDKKVYVFASLDEVYFVIEMLLAKKIDNLSNKLGTWNNSVEDFRGQATVEMLNEIKGLTLSEEGHLIDREGSIVEDIKKYFYSILKFRLFDYNRENSEDFYLPQKTSKTFARIKRLERQDKSADEIMGLVDLTFEEYESYMLMAQDVYSMDFEYGEGDSSCTLYEIVSDKENKFDLVEFEEVLRSIFLKAERQIDFDILMKSVFEDKTGKEIAEELGVSINAISERLKKYIPQTLIESEVFNLLDIKERLENSIEEVRQGAKAKEKLLNYLTLVIETEMEYQI